MLRWLAVPDRLSRRFPVGLWTGDLLLFGPRNFLLVINESYRLGRPV